MHYGRRAHTTRRAAQVPWSHPTYKISVYFGTKRYISFKHVESGKTKCSGSNKNEIIRYNHPNASNLFDKLLSLAPPPSWRLTSAK